MKFEHGILGIVVFLILVTIGLIHFSPNQEVEITELEIQVHELINQERQKQGLSPLKWNKMLAIIAENHSHDMNERHFFSHRTPEGISPKQRIVDSEYAVCQNSDRYGENILSKLWRDSIKYQNGIPVYDESSQVEFAKLIVGDWADSPSHRKNILGDYSQEGIGIVIAHDERFYITQNFC